MVSMLPANSRACLTSVYLYATLLLRGVRILVIPSLKRGGTQKILSTTASYFVSYLLDADTKLCPKFVCKRLDNSVFTLGSSMEREDGYNSFEQEHHELQGESANLTLHRLANSLASTELHRSDSGRSLRLRPSNASADQTISSHCLTPRAPRGLRPGGRRPHGATVMVPHQTCLAFKLDNNSSIHTKNDHILSDTEEPESIASMEPSTRSASENQKSQEGTLEKRRSSFSISTHILAQLQEDKMRKVVKTTEPLRYTNTIPKSEHDGDSSCPTKYKLEVPEKPALLSLSSDTEKSTPKSLYNFSLWSNAVKRPILPEAVGARNGADSDMTEECMTQRPRPRCYSSEAISSVCTGEVLLPIEEKDLKDARDMIARLKTDDSKSTTSLKTIDQTSQTSSASSREMSLTRSMSPKISKSSIFKRASSSLPTSAPNLPPRSTSLDSTIGKTAEAFSNSQSSKAFDHVYGNQKAYYHSQSHSVGTGSITQWKRGTLIGEGTFGKVRLNSLITQLFISIH